MTNPSKERNDQTGWQYLEISKGGEEMQWVDEKRVGAYMAVRRGAQGLHPTARTPRVSPGSNIFSFSIDYSSTSPRSSPTASMVTGSP